MFSRFRHITSSLALAGLLFVPAAIADAAGAGPPPPAAVSAHYLGAGGDQDTSPDGKLLVYDQPDSTGVYYLDKSTATGGGQTCLSCQAAPNRNVRNPVWSPDGQWIVAQREADQSWLALGGLNGQGWATELEDNGVWTDLYALSPDGSRWYKLTNVNTNATDGMMMPYFSADGKHLVWSKITENAGTDSNPWGTYRLMMGDFVLTNGVPSLQNVRDITPNIGGHFFESHGFSPDGSKVLFASDSHAVFQWNMNIFSLDLASGQATNLTKGVGWYEHGRYTPDGLKIVYMSSDGATSMYQTEFWMMNPDGSGKQQVTHFNTSGYPEYNPYQSMPIRMSWSPDGTQMAVTLQMANTYPARQLWVLTYPSACCG
jgi:Tol biopolymer transport system component